MNDKNDDDESKELRAQLANAVRGALTRLLIAETKTHNERNWIERALLDEFEGTAYPAVLDAFKRGKGSLQHFRGKLFALGQCNNPTCHHGKHCLADLMGPLTPEEAQKLPTNVAGVTVVVVACETN